MTQAGELLSFSGGRHRFVYAPEEAVMRVGDVVLKSVAFLGKVVHRDSSSWDGEPVGTGFFVTMRSAIEGGFFRYFVTAKHVVNKLKNEEAYVVVNSKRGGRTVIDLRPSPTWWFHPTDKTADVAVMQFPVVADHDVASVAEDMMLSEANRERFRIGVGDEVFVTGLFSRASGQTRNIPIVRHGNIAMMPDEQIQTRLGYADVYLIEARSLGGLSGSPVFVRETVALKLKDKQGDAVGMSGLGRMQLLGVMYGHWDVDESEINKSIFTAPGVGHGVNMGIGIVVPAIKIIEILHSPELVEMRNKTEDEERKRNLPTQD